MSEEKYVDKNMIRGPGEPLSLSVSAVQQAHESARDYWWKYVLGNKDEQTPAMKDGEIFHMMLLEPERFYESYFTDQDMPAGKAMIKTVEDLKGYLSAVGVKFKSTAKKPELMDLARGILTPDDNTLIYDDWLETMTRGREYVSRAKWERFHTMKDQVVKNKFVSRYLPLGKKEFPVEAELFGAKIRGRVDWLADEPHLPYVVCIDLKKTASAKRQKFMRQMEDQGGHIQLALYTAIIEKMYPGRQCLFAWVAAEDQDPFHCEVYSPVEAFIEAGLKDAKRAIDRIRHSYDTGLWPGYSDGQVQSVHPSHFLLERIAAEESEDEMQSMEREISGEEIDADYFDDGVEDDGTTQ